MNKYLGIDWGASKVGLAIADRETKLAFAYLTLKNDNKLFDNLRDIIDKESVKIVVIGVPSHEKHRKIFREKDFGEKIKSLGDVSVEYQGEFFTTKIAQRNLIEKNVRNISRHDDEESARIILQEWLDKNTK